MGLAFYGDGVQGRGGEGRCLGFGSYRRGCIALHCIAYLYLRDADNE
jgi:hypothetical protein